MEGNILYQLINYVPIVLLILGFGKVVESVYKMSDTAEHTLYLIEKMDDIERRLKIIDQKLNKQ